MDAAEIRLLVHDDGGWGWIDGAGKIVIPPSFSDASAFEDGRAVVELPDGREAYVDAAGVQQGPSWLAAKDCAGGRCAVKGDDGWWGYVDHAGKLVVPPTFGRAGPHVDGRAVVERRDGSYAVIDDAGREVWAYPPGADTSELLRYAEGLLVLEVGEGVSAFDADGRVVWTRADVRFARSYHDGLAAARAGERWGFLDHQGQWTVQPTLPLTWGVIEGLAAIQEDERWGFVDPAGKVVIPPRFTSVWAFHEGRAFACEGARCGYVGPDGAWLLQPRWADPQDAASSFQDGRALVRDAAGRRQWIDRDGQVVWTDPR